MVRNRGEKEMYYAEATHPAIIKKEEFDAVQMLLGQRAKRESCPENRSPFDQKVFCGQCGTSFRKKVSHGKVFWSCRKHNEDILSCPVTQVLDAEIRRAFLRLHYNSRYTVRLSSPKCSTHSRQSATVGCYGAWTSLNSTNKYRNSDQSESNAGHAETAGPH